MSFGNIHKRQTKFFINVIKNALPGALAIALTTAVVFLIRTIPGFVITDKEVTTIIVLNATFTCFTVLYKVCRPFNVVRRVLYFFVAAGAILLATIAPNLLDIVQILPIEFKHLPGYERMGIQGALLLICLMQATYPLIRCLENLKTWVKVRKDWQDEDAIVKKFKFN